MTPSVSSETVFVPLINGELIAINSVDGKVLWRAENGGEIVTSPLADARFVYVVTETAALGALTDNSRPKVLLRALSVLSGLTVWVKELTTPLQGGIVGNTTTLFATKSDGRLIAVSKNDGTLLWTREHPTHKFTTMPTLGGTDLFVGSQEGSLSSFKQTDGELTWRSQSKYTALGSPVVTDDSIFFSADTGYVYALNRVDGRIRWRRRTGAGVRSVLPVRDGILVASLDNFIYCYHINSGVLLWKRRMAGRIAAQPLAIADNVLVAPLFMDACVVLNARNGRVLNTIPVGEDNNTAASPIASSDMLLLTTRQGLIAYVNENQEAVKH